MPVCLVLAPNWFCRGASLDSSAWQTGECERAENVHYLVIGQKKCELCNLKLDQVTAFKVCDWL